MQAGNECSKNTLPKSLQARKMPSPLHYDFAFILNCKETLRDWHQQDRSMYFLLKGKALEHCRESYCITSCNRISLIYNFCFEQFKFRRWCGTLKSTWLQISLSSHKLKPDMRTFLDHCFISFVFSHFAIRISASAGLCHKTHIMINIVTCE